MKRVYIAGKLNDMACDYIKNVHRMIMWSEKVRKLGFAIYVPGIEDASDLMFVTPGWEKSSGTKREIERAKKQGMPICYTIEELEMYK